MNVQCHSCIGGTNLGEDIRKLDYGQHVVSGTNELWHITIQLEIWYPEYMEEINFSMAFELINRYTWTSFWHDSSSHAENSRN